MVGEGKEVDLFFDDFYRRFLQQPDTREFFAGADMDRQKQMLKKSLFELTSCWLLGQPSDGLMHLAEIHKQLKIPARMMDEWLEALLQTVADMDARYNETVRLAWLAAFGPGIFFFRSLLCGANYSDLDLPKHDRWYSGAADPADPKCA